MSTFFPTHNIPLHAIAEQIVNRTITQLLWSNTSLVSAETDISDDLQLQQIATLICQTCGRVVVLGSQSEYTHIILAKSSNVSHLYINEIACKITQTYGGEFYGDSYFAKLTLNKLDIVPEIIDTAVESIIVAMPYFRL